MSNYLDNLDVIDGDGNVVNVRIQDSDTLALVNQLYNYVFNGGDVILIGDSISTVTNSDSKTMFDIAEELSDRTVFKSGIAGAGFTSAANNFLSQLQNISGSNNVTDIYVFGGANDVLATDQAEIESAISDFVTYAASQFPNAKIHIGSCGLHWNIDAYQTLIHSMVIPAYKSITKHGGDYIHNFFGVYHASDLTYDSLHPTQSAVDILGLQIARLLNGYDVENDYSLVFDSTDVTPSTGITAVSYVYVCERVIGDTLIIAPDQVGPVQIDMTSATLSSFTPLFTTSKSATCPTMTTLSGMSAPTPVEITHADSSTSMGIVQIYKKYNEYGLVPVSGDFSNTIRITFAMPTIVIDLLEG